MTTSRTPEEWAAALCGDDGYLTDFAVECFAEAMEQARREEREHAEELRRHVREALGFASRGLNADGMAALRGCRHLLGPTADEDARD